MRIRPACSADWDVPVWPGAAPSSLTPTGTIGLVCALPPRFMGPAGASIPASARPPRPARPGRKSATQVTDSGYSTASHINLDGDVSLMEVEAESGGASLLAFELHFPVRIGLDYSALGISNFDEDVADSRR